MNSRRASLLNVDSAAEVSCSSSCGTPEKYVDEHCSSVAAESSSNEVGSSEAGGLLNVICSDWQNSLRHEINVELPDSCVSSSITENFYQPVEQNNSQHPQHQINPIAECVPPGDLTVQIGKGLHCSFIIDSDQSPKLLDDRHQNIHSSSTIDRVGLDGKFMPV
ncbi:unnamed protein product [Soboliphyme baturini]|uniref:Uncharacterized protein n=1 Tax=Soboliphyme baturini TaxID=241478 RepID=A0A183J431_9BILA|nr:unnamed protein product [Soboliphyme baturini]